MRATRDRRPGCDHKPRSAPSQRLIAAGTQVAGQIGFAETDRLHPGVSGGNLEGRLDPTSRFDQARNAGCAYRQCVQCRKYIVD